MIIMIVYCVIIVCGCLAVVEAIIHILFNNALLYVINVREFPNIKKEILHKFESFDKELGWVRQPNEHRVENNCIPNTSYSTDWRGSRSEINDYPADYEISTYGDSFCFCREVNDDETWQHFLSNKLKVNVKNYGVGNYSIDQALLRLKRQYPEDSTRYVIMAITPWSIMRVLSVWKHYSEFGNILATKPRFTIEDGKLKLIDNFIEKKEDFLRIAEFKDWLRENDFHYENYFKRHKIQFPYIANIFKDKCIFQKVFFSTILGMMIATRASRIKVCKRLNNYVHYKRCQFDILYKKKLFETQDLIFCSIINEFIRYSKEKEFIPVLMILPDYPDIVYMRLKGSFYANTLEKIQMANPRLSIIDLFDAFKQIKNTSDLFTITKYGFPGHINSKGNRIIADTITKKLII